MNISLPFITKKPTITRMRTSKNVNPKKRKMIKIRNEYTPIEIHDMDDSQVHYLYEHGSPAERDIASEIKRKRSNWDTVINKGLDDPLPKGSGVRGAPEAGSG